MKLNLILFPNQKAESVCRILLRLSLFVCSLSFCPAPSLISDVLISSYFGGQYFLGPREASAQELNIGFLETSDTRDFFQASDAYSTFLRLAVSENLVHQAQSEGKLSMALADSISWSPDKLSVRLKLRRAAQFSDGRLIAQHDLEKSLERCIKLGRSNSQEQERQRLSYSVNQESLGIFIDIMSDNNQDLLDLLTACPIFSAKSLQVFGDKFGSYNLFVATGPYLLEARGKKRESILVKQKTGSGWAKTITLRQMLGEHQGLSALRTGTLDMFFLKDESLFEQALKDETLLEGSCGVYRFIYRKGLAFDCRALVVFSKLNRERFKNEQVIPGSIRYVVD